MDISYFQEPGNKELDYSILKIQWLKILKNINYVSHYLKIILI